MGIRNLGNSAGGAGDISSVSGYGGAGNGGNPPQAKLDIDIDKIAEDAAAKRKSERKGYSDVIQSALETPQGSTISTGIITLLTVAMLIFFAIGPAINSVLSQLETNEFLRENISEISQKTSQINQTESYYQEAQNALALETFQGYMSNDPNQEEIYNEINQYAETANVEFRRINFNIENSNSTAFQNEINQSDDLSINFFFVDPRLRFQSITYEVVGNEDELQTFVEILESNNRGYDITSVSLSSPREDAEDSEDNPDATKWRMNLNFNLPYWNPGTDL